MGVTRNTQQTRRNDGKRHTKHTTTKMMYATVLFGVMLSCATAKKVLYHEFMGAQASTEAMIADYKPRWVEDPVWGGLSAVTLRDKQQYLRKGIQNFLSEFERNYTVGASQFWLTMKMECQMYRTLAKSGETYVHKKSEFVTGRTLKDVMDKFVAKLKQPQSFSYAMNLERPSGFNVVELGFEFYKDFKKVSAMKHMRDWSAHRAPLVTQGEAWKRQKEFEANRARLQSQGENRRNSVQFGPIRDLPKPLKKGDVVKIPTTFSNRKVAGKEAQLMSFSYKLISRRITARMWSVAILSRGCEMIEIPESELKTMTRVSRQDEIAIGQMTVSG